MCQSDNLVILNDIIKRVTFQLFILGLLHQMIAEHNCSSLCTSLEVDGKVIKQWDGVSLDKIAAEPFTFYHLDQKFTLKWLFADPDSGQIETFMLEANGAALSSLQYMGPNFKLVD